MRIVLVVALVLMAPAVGPAQEHLGKTLDQWRADLDSAEQIDRLLAARAIGEMAIGQQAGATEAILESLGHEDGSVRFWAAVATIHLPALDADALALLKEALADPVPEVRVQAARALVGTPAEPEALRTLAELLSHRNRGVRLQAVHAADAIKDKAAPLVKELQAATEDEFDYVQRVARHALWTLEQRPCPYRQCE
ncbi:MAG: HEAT repeat domain-containing protein [Bryobacterales bacterium]|nr:HEAT repeat domain-containing protein [Bryobacterales bacterium]MDE0261385.1 HEAT repeat domain-containing protein [Bryobacterales bacterium]MDE0622343.1 HEAT repeat domain-containing protein [Bryobacterales bacterium]